MIDIGLAHHTHHRPTTLQYPTVTTLFVLVRDAISCDRTAGLLEYEFVVDKDPVAMISTH